MADTGFHTSVDPLATKTGGYRSDSLRKPNPFMQSSQEFSYNGFHFPPAISAKVTQVPEYDKSNRTVKYVTFAIIIEAIITQFDLSSPSGGNSDLDSQMQILRDRLSQPGQKLTFTRHGFGVVKVQQSGSDAVNDVDYGPKPQVIDMEPIGGNLAFRVQWLCTTRIPPCYDTAQSSFNGVIERTSQISWDIPPDGFATRTAVGRVEIARSRNPTNNGVPTGSGNSEIHRLTQEGLWALDQELPFLRGYKQSVKVVYADDKKSSTYTITDKEIPTPQSYFYGAIDINLTESLSSNLDKGFNEWSWSLGGTISCPNSRKGNLVENKRQVFNAFFLVLKDRLRRAQNITYQESVETNDLYESTNTNQAKPAFWIPEEINISNEVYGNSISVSIRYTLICPSNLVMFVSGMFDCVSIPGTSWQSWTKFLNDEATLRPPYWEGNDSEFIVDLCQPNKPGNGRVVGKTPCRSATTGISSSCPPPEESWLSFKNDFEIVEDVNTYTGVVLNSIARVIRPLAQRNLPRSTSAELLDPGLDSTYSEEDNPLVAEAYAPPTYRVIMRGSAVRMGYQITTPRLVSVNGVPAIQKGKSKVKAASMALGISKTPAAGGGGLTGGTTPMGASGQCKMYMVTWEKEYVLEGIPRKMKNIKTDGVPSDFR